MWLVFCLSPHPTLHGIKCEGEMECYATNQEGQEYLGLASRAESQIGQNKVLQRYKNYCLDTGAWLIDSTLHDVFVYKAGAFTYFFLT